MTPDKKEEVQLLLQHYKENALTPDELLRLRTLLRFEREAFEAVMAGELDAGAGADLEAIDHRLIEHAGRTLRSRIEAESASAPSLRPNYRLRRALAYAAALLLPLLLASTLYFAYDASTLGGQSLSIATRQGERSTLTLPDGSTVALNPLSQVSYRAKDFSRSRRLIDYSGDGAFDIAKQPGAPFVIRTKDVEIRVLGTKFFFSARPDDKAAKVYLEEGSIELTAIRTGHSVRLKPCDWAEVDYSSGRITLSEHLSHSALNALKKGDLVFRDEPLSDVVRQLEVCYDYSFRLDASLGNSHFTGVLPTDNILATIRILEVTFGITSDVSNREIMFYKRR